MADYTPDEEQVREQYTQEQPPQIGSVAEKRAEFDRFIARIKAEAWDEGHTEGSVSLGIAVLHGKGYESPPNPYREDAGL